MLFSLSSSTSADGLILRFHCFSRNIKISVIKYAKLSLVYQTLSFLSFLLFWADIIQHYGIDLEVEIKNSSSREGRGIECATGV